MSYVVLYNYSPIVNCGDTVLCHVRLPLIRGDVVNWLLSTCHHRADSLRSSRLACMVIDSLFHKGCHCMYTIASRRRSVPAVTDRRAIFSRYR